jgi:hypothetical protein
MLLKPVRPVTLPRLVKELGNLCFGLYVQVQDIHNTEYGRYR